MTALKLSLPLIGSPQRLAEERVLLKKDSGYPYIGHKQPE
jgi:hypothetical protein